MSYFTTNPCFCSGSTSTPTSSVCGDGSCFCFCDIQILPDDDAAVEPCGALGIINLLDYTHDFTVCGTTATLIEIYSFDDTFFDTVTVSAAGNLEWSILAGTTNITGVVTMKAFCGDELGAYFDVRISKKNICSGVTCASGQICNECDGTCIPDPGAVVTGDVTIVIP